MKEHRWEVASGSRMKNARSVLTLDEECRCQQGMIPVLIIGDGPGYYCRALKFEPAIWR